MRIAVVLALLLAASVVASARGLITGPTGSGSGIFPGGPGFGITGSVGNNATPPPTCTPDGGTDWSNACDLPLLAAIGF